MNHPQTDMKLIPFNDKWSTIPEIINRVAIHGVCTPEEIERAIHPQNGNDYLLRIRAMFISDNVRLYQCMLHLVHMFGENWSLERFFSSDAYDVFKMSISESNYQKCKDVICGSIYDNNANGLIFESPFGVLSTFSITLNYFCRYANLALGAFQQEVPNYIRLNAMRIACRVMLRSEPDDFIADPRGKIPQAIQDTQINNWKYISEFLAGHELSHFILGHIKEQDKIEMGFLKPHFKDDTDYRKINGYRINQLQEFEADLAALNLVELPENVYIRYYDAALSWFAMLSVYEAVEDSISPPIGSNQTHPGAIARYEKILNEARRPKYFNEKHYVETLPHLIDYWREVMKDDVSLYFDKYEDKEHSVYLDAPNTEWRGRELIDRVDY